MIGFLRGKVVFLETDYAIMDVNGVGYRVFVSVSTRNHLRLNEEAALYIHTSVREDAIILYGFFSDAEYNAFTLLISVSGIGPKGALSVLSAITVEGLYKAIQNKDVKILTKLPGIGKKSAERLILELKDKVAFEGTDEELDITEETVLTGDLTDEAKAALTALGYSAVEVAQTLKKVKAKDSVENIIKDALKILNKF